MIFNRLPVGCGSTEYLLQLASCLLASRSLNTVDPRVALPGFGIDRELDFSHVFPLRV